MGEKGGRADDGIVGVERAGEGEQALTPDQAIAAINSRISEEAKPKKRYDFNTFYKQMVNEFDPLFRIVKTLTEGRESELTTPNDPARLAQALAGNAAKANHFIRKGTFSFKTAERVGKSLEEILTPAVKMAAAMDAPERKPAAAVPSNSCISVVERFPAVRISPTAEVGVCVATNPRGPPSSLRSWLP